MKKIHFLFFISLFSVMLCPAQQDPQYSQYMFNQLVINPAYAGSKNFLSATALARKQWVGTNGSPQTNSLSVHAPLKQKSLGLGGHLVNEQIGPKRWTASYLDLAYRIKLGKGRLSFGLAAGAVSYKYNFNQLVYEDPSELPADLGELNKNRTRFDASFGAYYYTNAFYVGYSVTHINEPDLYTIVSSNAPASSGAIVFNLSRHHFLTIGRGFALGENVVISPSILLKTSDPKRSVAADVNLNVLLHEKLWLGCSFRSGKTMVALAQYTIKQSFRVGYAFDTGISKYTRNGGSHELMIGYTFNKKTSSIVSPRYL